MKIQQLHPWKVSYTEAIALQQELQKRLILFNSTSNFNLVAGADVSYSKKSSCLYAGVVVFQLPQLEIVEQVCVEAEASFPYIPGLLTFREAPTLLKAFQQLQTTPDVVLFDGQGIAHPRGMGLASHMGLLLNLPTIGCAKSVLVGSYSNLGNEKGSQVPIVFRDKIVGVALRSRNNVKPIFISIGHKIDLETAVAVVQSCLGKFRIPEPIRKAHNLVNVTRSMSENSISRS